MDRLTSFENVVNEHLNDILTERNQTCEIMRPKKLVAAMRHAVLNGGKRFRPYLLMESAALFDVEPSTILPTACALECLHCYSLVHDDLPSMDDDDLRRGAPTVHRKFDEATAILAGDALLTFAFDLIATDTSTLGSDIRNELTVLLARAAGVGGMVGGQILDLEAESTHLDEGQIKQMQSMKTGALIRFACEAGAVAGGASAAQRSALVAYGKIIGAAFQLSDDLLDVVSTETDMGKAVSKDIDRGKATIVSRVGVEKTRVLLSELVEKANKELGIFGKRADALRVVAGFVATRNT